MEIKQALSKEDFMNCWEAVHELRPHLTEDQYLHLVLHMLDESYRMLFIEWEGKAVSICGYRFVTMLHRGRSIYIDDLYTLEAARGKGCATTLLQHVINEARENNFQSVHLDSGPLRFDAHKLYLNKGFRITAHHFSLELFT
jgi:GNAT superfamily N-acetyltransferase